MNKNTVSSKSQRARQARAKHAEAKMKASGIVQNMIPRLRRLANSFHQLERNARVQAGRVAKKLDAEMKLKTQECHDEFPASEDFTSSVALSDSLYGVG